MLVCNGVELLMKRKGLQTEQPIGELGVGGGWWRSGVGEGGGGGGVSG